MKSAHKAAFHSIQGLRALAALMVLLLHILPAFGVKPWQSWNQGVELFFCISGFVMYVSMAGRPTGFSPFLHFLRRRFVRVVPFYWLFLSLYIVEIYPALRFGRSGRPDAVYTWASYLLVFVKVPGVGWSGDGIQWHWPLLPVGWTLTFELFFYVCFAVTILCKTPPFWLAPLLVGMSAVGPFSRASWPAMAALCNPILLCFLAGMLIARFVPQIGRWPRWPLLAFCCAYLLVIAAFRGQPSALQAWGLTMCSNFLVAAAVSLELQGVKLQGFLVASLGDASYSLYLSHFLLVHVAHHFLDGHALAPAMAVLGVVVCVAICCFAAVVIHRRIETPLVEGLNRWFGGRRRVLFDSAA